MTKMTMKRNQTICINNNKKQSKRKELICDSCEKQCNVAGWIFLFIDAFARCFLLERVWIMFCYFVFVVLSHFVSIFLEMKLFSSSSSSSSTSKSREDASSSVPSFWSLLVAFLSNSSSIASSSSSSSSDSSRKAITAAALANRRQHLPLPPAAGTNNDKSCMCFDNYAYGNCAAALPHSIEHNN